MPAEALVQAGWHAKIVSDVLLALHSHEHGLTKEEAVERFQKYGLNKLPEGKVDGLLLIFLHQFQSPLIYILFVAAGIVFAMGSAIDASIIFIVLFFNAILGTAISLLLEKKEFD